MHQIRKRLRRVVVRIDLSIHTRTHARTHTHQMLVKAAAKENKLKKKAKNPDVVLTSRDICARAQEIMWRVNRFPRIRGRAREKEGEKGSGVRMQIPRIIER